MLNRFVVRRLLILGLLVSGFLACSEPLPEYYGLYARSHRTLVSLSQGDDPARWSLDPRATFLVFDKLVASDSTPLVLSSARLVRYEIEKELERPQAQTVLRHHLVPLGQGEVHQRIDLRFRPVDDRPEMLEAIPSEELRPGVYFLTISDRQYSLGVELSGAPGLEPAHYHHCVDRHLRTVDIEKRFTWDAWFSLTQNARPRSSTGNVVLGEASVPCQEWDAEAQQDDVQIDLQSNTRSIMTEAAIALMNWHSDAVTSLPVDPSPPPPPRPHPVSLSRTEGTKIKIDLWPASTIQELRQHLSALPVTDGWGHPLEYRVNLANLRSETALLIRSPGRDGEFQEDGYTFGWYDTSEYDRDIVWADGFFIAWPEERQ